MSLQCSVCGDECESCLAFVEGQYGDLLHVGECCIELAKEIKTPITDIKVKYEPAL